MSNVSPFRAVPALSSDAAEPMPSTKTRRTIKQAKSEIARLKREVKAEQRRIALLEEMSHLEAKLRDLREVGKVY